MKYQSVEPGNLTKPSTDYFRVMAATSQVSLGDVVANVKTIGKLYSTAKNHGANLLLTPELSLTGYSVGDLFFNHHLIARSFEGLVDIASTTLNGPALVVGLPLEFNGLLLNCAALLAEGKIAGIVPKSYIPNYQEFYEKRWFTSGSNISSEIMVNGCSVPIGPDILFDVNGVRLGIEICEDAWTPISPSTLGCLAGAEIFLNPSASNELIGKSEYRKNMLSMMSGKSISGYVYASSGPGESTADVVYGGSLLIIENGRVVSERKPLSKGPEFRLHDFDMPFLRHDRLVNKTFADQKIGFDKKYRTLNVVADSKSDRLLYRSLSPKPYVPSDPLTLDVRCKEIISQASYALAERHGQSHTDKLVLGLSGGLDSLLMLFICLEAASREGKSADIIHALTLPGPASSSRTQDNSMKVAEAVGAFNSSMPIQAIVETTLKTIGHDGSTEDTTYENTQARTRTMLLMNYSNMVNGMMVGTGDMSEITQGWCTYNGDHMSMYNPNAGIPKTLVRHLALWYSEKVLTGQAQKVALDIIGTPISPELTGKGELNQITEDIIGPYELADFFDYYKERYGADPSKIGYLATIAFKDKYDANEISRWLNSFLRRDVLSQWKMEVMPNGPKYGSVSKSPRGDRRLAPNISSKWML